MLIENLLVVGAGGHAKVLVDAVRCLWGDQVSLLLADDNQALESMVCMGLPIVTPVARAVCKHGDFHVAIGHNGFRARLADFCIQAGMVYQSIIHPRASVAASATVHNGSFVAAHAVVAPMVTLNVGCIVNHGAVVDHDCMVGSYSHIAPNATLAGEVQLGEQVLIGAGANILPGVIIGDGCVVGAGAVVLHDLPAHTTYAGVPARQIK